MDALFSTASLASILSNLGSLLIAFIGLGLLFLGKSMIHKALQSDSPDSSRREIAEQKARFREGWVGDSWVSPRSRRENGGY